MTDAMTIPKATHTGKLFDGLVDCYVLDNGQRILSQRGVVRAITNGSADKTQLERYFDRLPDKYRHLAVPPNIKFRLPVGGLAKGREASWFVDLLNAYDEASDEGLLHPSQEHLARNARRIGRALKNLGMIALIDEATGYQDHRAPTELGGILKMMLRDEHSDWNLMWPHEFVDAICRLYGYRHLGGSHPQWMCSIYQKLYEVLLTKRVYEELKRRNPDPKHGENHHQMLTDQARSQVAKHVPGLTLLAETCSTKEEFWEKVRHSFQGTALQLTMRTIADWRPARCA